MKLATVVLDILVMIAGTTVHGAGPAQERLRRRDLIHALPWKAADIEDTSSEPFKSEKMTTDFVREADWGASSNHSELRTQQENDEDEQDDDGTCGDPGLGMCEEGYHCECFCEDPDLPPAAETCDAGTLCSVDRPCCRTPESGDQVTCAKCGDCAYPQIVEESCCIKVARLWRSTDFCCKCGENQFKFVSDPSDCLECDDVTTTTTTSAPETTSKPDTTTTTTTTSPQTTSKPDTTAKPATTTSKPATSSTTTTSTTTTSSTKDDSCQKPDGSFAGKLGDVCDTSITPYAEEEAGSSIVLACCLSGDKESSQCVTCDMCNDYQIVASDCCSNAVDKSAAGDCNYCCKLDSGFKCVETPDECKEPLFNCDGMYGYICDKSATNANDEENFVCCNNISGGGGENRVADTCSACSACKTDDSGAYPSACCAASDDTAIGSPFPCPLGKRCCLSTTGGGASSEFRCMDECDRTSTKYPTANTATTTTTTTTDAAPNEAEDSVQFCSIGENYGKVCAVDNDKGSFSICCNNAGGSSERYEDAACIPCDECNQACCWRTAGDNPVVGASAVGCKGEGFHCCPSQDEEGHICVLDGCPSY